MSICKLAYSAICTIISEPKKLVSAKAYFYTFHFTREKDPLIHCCCCSNISLQRKYKFKQAKLRRSNNLLFINLSSIGTHFKAISSPGKNFQSFDLTPPQPCHSKHASAHMSNDYNLSQLDNSTIYMGSYRCCAVYGRWYREMTQKAL